MRLLVLAKAPLPGRAKTRLSPPLSRAAAADVATAALTDTLSSAAAVAAAEPVLVLDGPAGSWLPSGMPVLPQRPGRLDERIAGAFADAGTPALLIGMDTPQVSAELLEDAIARLRAPGVDAVLGFAEDGGWWAAGLSVPDPGAFTGVPMSTAFTGRAQLHRMRSLGLRVDALPTLRDVDTYDDAVAVAGLAPGSRFAHAVAAASAGGDVQAGGGR